MSDAVARAADRPAWLLLLSVLLLLTVLVPRLRPRWLLWQRVLWSLATFAVATVAIVHTLGSPFAPRFDRVAGGGGTVFWERLIDTAWWLIAGRLAVGLVRLLVVLENKPQETRIVADLLAGAINVAVALCIVSFAFALPIRGLLATSGVIAIVLGLALQSTLADVFSGIAVGVERPYKPGDHLWVEGGIEGRVMQISWRSTQIATDDGNLAIVPNNVIAKARLINRSAPTERRGEAVTVVLHAAAVPADCVAALTAAALGCSHLLDEPRPGVACVGMAGEGCSYRIDFSVASSAFVSAARTELFDQVHRHLRHAGIPLAVAGAALLPSSVPTIGDLLDASDWFGVLDAAHRARLASDFTPVRYAVGDVLIRAGELPDVLLMVATGTVAITGDDPGRILHRVGPGETLGAVGLITGEPYSITATALTPVGAFAVARAAIGAATEADPELARGLERLAAGGLARLRRGLTPTDDAKLARPDAMLAGFRSFLRLLRT